MKMQKRRVMVPLARAPFCPLHPPWNVLSACHPSTAFSSYLNAWTVATYFVSSVWHACRWLLRVAAMQWLVPCAAHPHAWPRAGGCPPCPRSPVCCLAMRARHCRARVPCALTDAGGFCTCGHHRRLPGRARAAQCAPHRLHPRCDSAARCHVACP